MSKYRPKKSKLNRKIVVNTNNYMVGARLYIYRNNTGKTLLLPKKSKKGEIEIEPNGEFEGDDYFMQMVQNNTLLVVKEIVQEENTTMQEKLILDQPETVTQQGVVEQVVVDEKNPNNKKKKKKNVNENETQTDVLLTEDPLEGVTIFG